MTAQIKKPTGGEIVVTLKSNTIGEVRRIRRVVGAESAKEIRSHSDHSNIVPEIRIKSAGTGDAGRIRGDICQDQIVPVGAGIAQTSTEVRDPALAGTIACELLVQESNLTFIVDGKGRIEGFTDVTQIVRRPGLAAIRRSAEVKLIASVGIHRGPCEIDHRTVGWINSNSNISTAPLLAGHVLARVMKWKLHTCGNAPSYRSVAVFQISKRSSSRGAMVIADNHCVRSDYKRICLPVSGLNEPAIESHVIRCRQNDRPA